MVELAVRIPWRVAKSLSYFSLQSTHVCSYGAYFFFCKWSKHSILGGKFKFNHICSNLLLAPILTSPESILDKKTLPFTRSPAWKIPQVPQNVTRLSLSETQKNPRQTSWGKMWNKKLNEDKTRNDKQAEIKYQVTNRSCSINAEVKRMPEVWQDR